MENNNKESFKLLAVTGSNSDSGSEVPEFVLTPKKKRLKRRVRANHTVTRARQPQSSCACGARSISLSLATAVLLCWMLTLSWLAYILHGEVSRLDSTVREVVAGSQGVPDDLQKIHSLSRELQQNQTMLTSRMNSFSVQLTNLSQELMNLQSEVHRVQDRLQFTPEPVNVKELSASVAQFGGQIRDLMTTVASLKQQSTTLDATTQVLSNNISAIDISVGRLLNASLQPTPLSPDMTHTLENLHQALVQTAANLTEANSTLTKRLQWLQDDQLKDHKSLEGLQDLGQNVSARIKTLEGECAKNDAQTSLNRTVLRLEDQVNASVQRLQVIEQSMLHQPVATPAQMPADFTRSTTVVRPSPLEPSEAAIEEGQISSPQPTLLDEGNASVAPTG